MALAQGVFFLAAMVAILLLPFALLVNLAPVQQLMLFLAGTVGGPGARFPLDEAMARVRDLLSYLAWRDPLVNDGFYSALELAHMIDVVRLFQAAYGACLASVVTLMLLWPPLRRRGLHWRPLRAAGIATLSVAGFLCAVLLTAGFGTAFTLFHEVAFANDLWLLPEKSSLIRLFPEKYFATYFAAALGSSGAISLILVARRRTKH